MGAMPCHPEDAVEVAGHDVKGGDLDGGIIALDAVPKFVNEPAVEIKTAAVVFANPKPQPAFMHGDGDPVKPRRAVILE